MNWLLAHEDRDVSFGYVPVLCHPLRKLGKEEQVNVCGDEKAIRVGEMEDNQHLTIFWSRLTLGPKALTIAQTL